jgi:diguanylate cyclase (GGDEF)-like protein
MVGTLRRQSWLFPAIAGLVALVCAITRSVTVQAVGAALVALALVPVAVVAWRARSIATEALVGLSVLAVCNIAAVIMHDIAADHANLKIWAEGVTVVATVIVIGGMCFIARHRLGRDFWGTLADGGIVALGGWLLAWVTLVRPALDNDDNNPAMTLLLSTFAPLGSIVVFMLVITLVSASRRTVAATFLSVAITLALAAGMLHALHESGHIQDLHLLRSDLKILANGFLIAAIFHPSVKSIIDRQVTPRRAMLGRVLLTTAALIVPVVVISATNPESVNDRVVRMLSVGLLALLVMLRIVQAVRANREAQEELLRSARTDSLTGLPNRILLLEHINATLRESWKGAEHPTLFFIDLDRFKNINDSLGHSAGDQVLSIVADRLRRAVPERATVARISGDEYVVLDPASPSLDDAMKLAHRLLAEFREPLALPAGDVFVTASIGVARSEPQSHRSADVLLRHADTAMYQAKDAGRNRVALFDVSMHERVAHRLTVETALFRALDRRELKLYYQPILEMLTGEVIGFEALMRWQQGDGTIVSPAEFIPIAEETGTIVPIGSWALFEALTQLRKWIDEGVCSPTANMSVNVSPRQLADPNFPTIVHEALQMSRIPSHLLWLEVTEGIMITEPELALATLRRLRSLGVRVAIDDFGTGYSSLSLLQKFPLQRIKIDRAFVHGVADNNNDRSLVRTIIAMGSTLGLDMVAEGVETVQQLQVLSELGCTKAQGYLISHPVPGDAMRTTVAALERMGAWPGVRRGREAFLVREEELAG